MKKIITGIGFEITGVLLIFTASLITGLQMANITSWITEMGPFWYSMSELKLVWLFVTGCIFLVIGVVMCIWDIFSERKSEEEIEEEIEE